MNQIVQIMNLRKSYAGQPAVRDVSLNVAQGQMLALLGPNGAGKSTTISILCTSLAPDSGTVKIDGLTLGPQNQKIRKQIGVVFQHGVLDDLLTVEQNLFTRGRFYGLRGYELEERIYQTASMTGIENLLNRRYGQLSGGQQRRCDIARALLHLPKLLILDEPTTGLDPEMRYVVWQTIANIRKQTGMTILLTTHYMEEAAIADEIVVLKDGKIAAMGSPAFFKARYAQDHLILLSDQCEPLCRTLAKTGVRYRRVPEGLEVPLANTRGALPILELCQGRFAGFEVQRGSMDDAYLSIIKGGEQPV